MTRYVFVTGGVVSSLGKGIASAALGALLQARGYSVRLRKMDPYLNVDPGTMNPFQHGEVFVTADGVEADLDLGHYERFTGCHAERDDSITAGRIYRDIIVAERRGDYLGATVQVIPHVTDAIKSHILAGDTLVDFIICEIGGTVGDIEALPFFEAIRQLRNELPDGHTVFVHVTLVPFIRGAGELKTKPTQHSVKELLSTGIQPDILLCRSDHEIPVSERKKISLFCNVSESAVIQAPEVESIYDIPVIYSQEGLDAEVLKAFGMMDTCTPNLEVWQSISHAVHNPEGEVRIGIFGKYTKSLDAYTSLREALVHGGLGNKVRVVMEWIDSETFAEDPDPSRLSGIDGVLVPGGFGVRGTEGKILAAKIARTANIPFLGICLGMQMAVVEVARHVAGLSGAGSTEFGDPEEPVVGLITEWESRAGVECGMMDGALGGTMRLGSYEACLLPGSRAASIYGTERIFERHRHRYEVNIRYRERLELAGLVFSGMSRNKVLTEIIELSGHPWFIGVQYHPELVSKPFAPHPLFSSFIAAAVERSKRLS